MDFYETNKDIDKERIIQCLEFGKVVDLQYYIYEENKSLWYSLYKHNDYGFTFDIEERRCNTEKKLLKWIKHLTEKNWITNDHIYQLITLYQIHNQTNFRNEDE